MRIVLCMALLITLASGQALAEGCDVVTRSSSDALKPVQRHTCYSYGRMPAEAIAWSCSNESKEMLNSQKRRVARCADGSVGSCIAPLTQETLANPDAARPPARPCLRMRGSPLTTTTPPAWARRAVIASATTVSGRPTEAEENHHATRRQR